MTAYHYITATGDQRIDGVMHGDSWNVTNLTFAFPSFASYYGAQGYQAIPNIFLPVSAQMANVIRYATSLIESYTNLGFTELNLNGGGFADLNFAVSDGFTDPDGTTYPNPTALGFFPNMTAGGDVWFNPYQFGAPTLGDYAYGTALHEFGHAIGMKHPHDPGNSLGGSNFGVLPAAYDSIEFTVMSYKSYVGQTSSGFANTGNTFMQTYMMLDIAALQHMYGADYSDTTNNTYAWSPSDGVIFGTIWDGGGTDTFDFSAFTTMLEIDLRPGFYSNTNSGQASLLNGGEGGTPIYARGNVFNAWLFEGNLQSLMENAIGSSGNDTIRGNQGTNTLTGAAGNDFIYGEEAVDRLYGGAGDDVLFGGSGFDSLYGGDGADNMYGGLDGGRLYGGNGNDRGNFYSVFNAEKFYGGAGNDRSYTYGGLSEQDDYYGGAGDDTLYFYGGTDALKVDLNAGELNNRYGGFTNALDAQGFEHVIGSDNNDWLIGTSGGNKIYGADGHDLISGGAGVDTLYGGNGNDRLFGGAGGDKLYGGAGEDTVNYNGASSGVTANLGNVAINTGHAAGDSYTSIENLVGTAHSDKLYGDSGNNKIVSLGSSDSVYGGGGNDVVNGGGGNDVVVGGDGNDIVVGSNGNDRLFGGNGNDTLYGGAGNDTLSGDAGMDVLFGGAGGDIFDFNAVGHSAPGANHDVIRDYNAGLGDRVDLITIDANTTVGGNQAFSFIGGAAFSGTAGQLRFTTGGGNGFLVADVNGDTVADMTIELLGVTALGAGSLFL